MASQDSVSFDLSASEQQRLKEYEEDDDMEPSDSQHPPIAKQPTPMDPIFDKKNHPALANPQGGAGKGLPLRPAREVSMASSVGASKLASMRIASQSQDVEDEEDNASAATATATAKKPAADAAAAKSTADDETTEESEEEVELTAEEKEKAELVKNINDVIARVKAAGYTFGGRSETAAAAMYLDDKMLFDDEGLGITVCASGDKKKITLGSVSGKIKELRKAAEEKKRLQAMVPAQGESQFEFGSDNEEEEEEEKSEAESDDEDYTTYTEAQLDASIARMKAELTVATKQHEVGPVKVVLKKYNQALNDEKKTIERDEYLKRKKEINDIKEYFTEDVRKKKTLV